MQQQKVEASDQQLNMFFSCDSYIKITHLMYAYMCVKCDRKVCIYLCLSLMIWCLCQNCLSYCHHVIAPLF